MPPGHYELTYFLGDPNGERPKVRVTMKLAPGESRVVKIPVFSEKFKADDPKNKENTNQKKMQISGPPEDESEAPTPAADHSPSTLQPLQ